MQPSKLYIKQGNSVRYLCLLVLTEGLFFSIKLYGYQSGLWGWKQLKGWEFLEKKQ